MSLYAMLLPLAADRTPRDSLTVYMGNNVQNESKLLTARQKLSIMQRISKPIEKLSAVVKGITFQWVRQIS